MAGTSGVVFVTETAHLLGVGPTTLVLLDRPQPAGAQISSSATVIDAGSERKRGTPRAAMVIEPVHPARSRVRTGSQSRKVFASIRPHGGNSVRRARGAGAQ